MLLDVHGLPEHVSSLESWLLHGGILGWLIASVLAVLGLFWPDRFGRSPTNTTGAIAAGALVAYFLSRIVSAGVEPLANAFEVLVLISLGTVLAYFISLLKGGKATLAAWVYPAAFVTSMTALPFADAGGPSVVGLASRERFADPLLITHVLLMVMSCALFTFAAMTSIVYLLQDRALRRKRHNRVLQSLPSLESLVVACLSVGLPLLTVSLVTGFIYVWEDLGTWIKKPIVLLSIALWLVFAITTFGRLAGFFHGRRLAAMVLAGFGLVVITFFGAGLLPGRHSFVDQGAPPAQPSDTP